MPNPEGNPSLRLVVPNAATKTKDGERVNSDVATETTDVLGGIDLLAIIAEVEVQAKTALREAEARAKEARETKKADTLKKLDEIARLETELTQADEKISHLPKDIKNKALVAMKPRRDQIEKRITELSNDPGVLIDSIDKLIAKADSTADWGSLSRLAQECIDSGFLTAEKNKKGNISFITVKPMQGKDQGVNKQVIKLSRAIHEASMYLEKEARKK